MIYVDVKRIGLEQLGDYSQAVMAFKFEDKVSIVKTIKYKTGKLAREHEAFLSGYEAAIFDWLNKRHESCKIKLSVFRRLFKPMFNTRK